MALWVNLPDATAPFCLYGVHDAVSLLPCYWCRVNLFLQCRHRITGPCWCQAGPAAANFYYNLLAPTEV